MDTNCVIRNVNEHVGETVTIGAWINNKRSSGKIQFLQLRDGTGYIQGVVVKSEVSEEIWNDAKSLTQESSVYVTGIIREEPRSASGYEMTVTGVQIIHLTENYPITPKEHGVDFLMDHRHLWLRSTKQRAVMVIRAEIIRAVQQFFDGNGFTQVDPPILTPSSAEGTTNLFHIKYFDEDAYLTQSGQLYMEAAAMALGKVYSFGPTFRAEKSKTRRHLIEFWMIEPEMAFVDHEESLRVQEKFIAHVVQSVVKNCRAELESIGRDVSKLEGITAPFPRITYDEAIEFLNGQGFDIPWGEDFGAPHETAIAEKYNTPVFITHYPAGIKAFYMKPDPNRPEVVLCADMIAPEGYGEIIGGSQRIDDPELMQQRFEEHNLSDEAYQWYLDLRKYGSVPHSGFGLGLERTVAWICGLDHVRETIAFPRMLYRLYPLMLNGKEYTEDMSSKAWLSGAAYGMAAGTAQLPYALLRFYHQLGLSDAEVLLLIQLLGFRQAEFNEFPTLEELASRMGLAPEGIARMLQRLMRDGYITIDEHRDEERDIQYERYDLHGLYAKLAKCTADEAVHIRSEQQKGNASRPDSNSVQKEEEERNMFSIFEKEFGRPLSPMECETISSWLDQDRYQEELILMALKEAVFAGKVHFRYIDRILLEWSRNRVKNVQDAKAYTQRFRNGGR